MDAVTLRVVAAPHIEAALREDITNGDVSACVAVPESVRARATLYAKQAGIVAGLDVFALVFEMLDPSARCSFSVRDGDVVDAGDVVGIVEGGARALLSGERTALNYLQRMSGIATCTRRVTDILTRCGSITKVVDTRKTTPGMRVFEKEAVRIGGGTNHRFNLSDGVMLKDNHLAAAGGVAAAVRAVRSSAPFVHKVEVECETLDQVAECLENDVDIIMLDNMSVENMRLALDLIAGRVETECSGNIGSESIESIAGLGLTYVSMGALTHSAGIVDMSLKDMELLR